MALSRRVRVALVGVGALGVLSLGGAASADPGEHTELELVEYAHQSGTAHHDGLTDRDCPEGKGGTSDPAADG